MFRIIFILAILVLVGCSKSEEEQARDKAEMTEIKVNRFGRERVQSILKDPGSAEFRNEVAFCGEVNSKNSFGAYTGFKRYIAASDSLIIMENDLPRDQFNKYWGEFCKSYAN